MKFNFVKYKVGIFNYNKCNKENNTRVGRPNKIVYKIQENKNLQNILIILMLKLG